MRKQSWPIWGCAESWIVVFKNQLYWKAFDQEGFSHGFPILRTSKGKNFVNCIFLRWLGFQCEKENGCLQAVRRIKLNRLDVRRAVMWKISLFLYTIHCIVLHVNHMNFLTFPIFETFFDLPTGTPIHYNAMNSYVSRNKCLSFLLLCLPNSVTWCKIA